VMMGQVEVIEFLLKNGAKIDVVNDYSCKPFCLSLQKVPPFHDHYPIETFEKIVKLFIEAGLDLNDTARISKSYLGTLALSGALEAIKILVAYGADINIQDQHGFTPLHNAAVDSSFKKEQTEVTKWLISVGADIKIKTNDGRTFNNFSGGITADNHLNIQARETSGSKDQQSPSMLLTKMGVFSTSDKSNTDDEIPLSLQCPITCDLMKRPVLCAIDGCTYEEENIREWLSKHRRAPKTNQEMKPGQCIDEILFPNRNIADAIEEFKATHPNLSM